jgi:hypothetical protein
VVKMYNLLLHRTPDLTGLNNFVSFMQGGGTAEQVGAIIAGSPEYFMVRGGGTNDGFLTALFSDFLNRAVDSTGRSNLDNLLNHGTTAAAVAGLVLGSQEYEQDIVQGFYQQFLHRAADSGGLAGAVNQLQHGQRDETVIAGIIASDEYFSRL